MAAQQRGHMPCVAVRDFLLFASDADLLAATGGLFVLFAALCSVMERLRVRRARIDRVGWVPWTGLFVAFALIGGGLLVFALPTAVLGG